MLVHRVAFRFVQRLGVHARQLVEGRLDAEADFCLSLLLQPPIKNQLFPLELGEQILGDRFDLRLFFLGQFDAGLRQQVEDRQFLFG